MQIDKPGRYRMRGGGVAEVEHITAGEDGYAEGFDGEFEEWWNLDGSHVCRRRDCVNDLIARIDGPDDPQPPKDKG